MSIISRKKVRLDPLAFSADNLHRTPGLHLTDIIRDVMTAIGKGHKPAGRSGGGFSEEQLADFALQGFLWEQVVEMKLRELVKEDCRPWAIDPANSWCPGEMAYDGGSNVILLDGKTPPPKGFVIISPDRVLWDDETATFRLGEFKWSTKSCPQWDESGLTNTSIVQQWIKAEKPDWEYQVKGYLLVLSVYLGQPIVEVERHLQFPCGNYRGSGVQYEVWVERYEPGEIFAAWEMLWKHAHDRVRMDAAHEWGTWL
jgi:hypothetical protein